VLEIDNNQEEKETMIIIQDISERVLSQSLRTESKYVSIMNSCTSHEMRNPLNSISSNIDNQKRFTGELKSLLGDLPLQEEQKAQADSIIANQEKSLKISKSSCSMMMFNVEDLLALP